MLGKVVFLAGCILILAAVFGRAGLMGLNADRAQAKLPAVRTLAEAYPQYPTWLVPETAVGFGVAAVLVLVGMAMTVLAEQEQRGRRR